MTHRLRRHPIARRSSRPPFGVDFLLGGCRIFVRVADRPSLRGVDYRWEREKLLTH